MLLFCFFSHSLVLNLCMLSSLLWLWLSLSSGRELLQKKYNNFCAGGLFGQYRFVGGWVWGHGTLRLYIYVNNSQEFSDCIWFGKRHSYEFFCRREIFDFSCIACYNFLLLATTKDKIAFQSCFFPSSATWLYIYP